MEYIYRYWRDGLLYIQYVGPDCTLLYVYSIVYLLYLVRRCRLHHWNAEDKYCTVKGKPEPGDNESVPVDV